jgi:methionyl-tRNA formyltransferase
MSDKLRIVFMGTPDFAAASLKRLNESGKNIVGVITAPDKPAGRGMKLQPSAVKEYAVANGLTVLQPEKLKAPEFIEQLKALEPELGIVVAFRMLPEVVWSMPTKGTFNLHGSLLPDYRGAAPIHWAVINGEEETGVTTFFLRQEIDTGDIIFQEKTPIGDYETTGDVYERLMNIGADLVVKTVDAIEADDVPRHSQLQSQNLKPAPKIFKDTARIDWNRDPLDLHNFIRGMSPFPGAWTVDDKNQIVKIYRSDYERIPHKLEIGNALVDGDILKIACLGGFVLPKELQSEGRKKLNVAEWLRGNSVNNFQ